MSTAALLPWHQGALACHATQAILLTTLLTQREVPAWNLTQSSMGQTHRTYSHSPLWMLPAFSALSSINHAVSAFSPTYLQYTTAHHVNPVQWGEYAVSAGLMTWVLGVSSGMTDVGALTSLLMLNGAMQYTGHAIEVATAARDEAATQRWMFMGWALFVAIWWQIMWSFFTALSFSDNNVPLLVYFIIFVMCAFFLSFGINQAYYVQSRQGTSRGTAQGTAHKTSRRRDAEAWQRYQKRTILLSFISKSALVWMCYGGLTRKKE
jgi:hypothetical protein